MGRVATTVPHLRRVAVGLFNIVTSDGTDTVDEEQLSKTLEDYLAAGMMEEYPSVVVTLDGSQTQIDGGTVFDYTGYVIISTRRHRRPGTRNCWRDLMFYLTDVQAAGRGLEHWAKCAWSKSIVADSSWLCLTLTLSSQATILIP
jgi:hypothetical protein